MAYSQPKYISLWQFYFQFTKANVHYQDSLRGLTPVTGENQILPNLTNVKHIPLLRFAL